VLFKERGGRLSSVEVPLYPGLDAVIDLQGGREGAAKRISERMLRFSKVGHAKRKEIMGHLLEPIDGKRLLAEINFEAGKDKPFWNDNALHDEIAGILEERSREPRRRDRFFRDRRPVAKKADLLEAPPPVPKRYPGQARLGELLLRHREEIAPLLRAVLTLR
jgi:hypothetical protein